jgi:hypothetical protein
MYWEKKNDFYLENVMLVFLYILNVTLLILHEIESAYEKEWDILKLPGKITGFLLFHIPILFLMFYGLLCIIQFPQTRLLISVVSGIAGFVPFMVHKLIVPKKGHFNKPISNAIIIGNVLSGMTLIIIGIIDKS